MPDRSLAAGEGEFAFIQHHLRPLAAGHPGALELKDDASLLEPTAGMQLVLAKDALVEGVHFLPHDKAEHVAQKALRVNLSDMAAMGATPRGYLLALMRPKRLPPEWLARFSYGLSEDQAAFGVTLLGGDTVVTPGPLSLSMTMLGETPRGQALRRDGARSGDDIYVSGTLGGAALGLEVLKGRLSPPMSASDFLIRRYRLPEPRIGLGEALRGVAHAAIDISDGLLADLGHVLEVSQKGAEVHTDRIPLSQAATPHRGALEAALAGGDDYELLFTADPEQRPAIQEIGRQQAISLTLVGRITDEPTLDVLDAKGRPFPIDRTGWQHF